MSLAVKYCDLHMHSTASDGTAAPGELARLAKEAGLSAIALTDHDTTAGVGECEQACREADIAFASGVEFSAEMLPEIAGADPRVAMHVLGYFIRHDDPDLLDVQQWVQEARKDRNPRMVAKLGDLGMAITYDDVLEVAARQGTQVVGRPHIAQVLVERGYVKSIHEAFTRYIGYGAPAYVPKRRLTPRLAIDAIHGSGGLAVLAHPVQLHLPDLDTLAKLVVQLKRFGLDGIETHHSDHSRANVRAFQQMAADFNLLTTGGSDYHGSRKPIELGEANVPYEVYERLRAAWERGRTDR